MIRHALRNALLPLVTLMALDLPTVFGGAVFIETIFSWPGIGRMAYESILARDYPVIMGTILLYAIFLVIANVLVDITYAWLDPRIRLEA